MDECELLILGAGVAGLSAARQLSRSCNVIVLEARSRVGGRLLTHRSRDLLVPVDLGPEFIHGRPREVFELLGESRLIVYDLTFNHFEPGPRGLQPVDQSWDHVEKLLEGLSRVKRDQSFQDYIDSRKVDEDVRRRAIGYIEGFNAAEADRISVKSIVKSNEEEDQQQGDRQHRLVGGYDQLAEGLARSILSPSRIDLNTIVTQVRWKKHRVEVETRTPAGARRYRARRIIVTLPLGVLQLKPGEVGAIRFEPELPTRKAIDESLVMGSVVKFTLVCRRAFWEDAQLDLSFVHALDCPIPVWWTSHPLRTTHLTGWAGGAPAKKLPRDSSGLMELAIESLSVIFRRSKDAIAREVISLHTHDWDSDPFSRGAYSYVAVDGMKGQARLAEPIADTIFFAGEHVHVGMNGTVAGAIQTGYEAARRITKNSS